MEETVWLIYVGPPGQVRIIDNGKTQELVPGQRYQMSVELAEENLKPNNATHWKRPDPPKTAAVKE